MNRRSFMALASGLLVPEPKRVYSFLWGNPVAYMDDLEAMERYPAQTYSNVLSLSWDPPSAAMLERALGEVRASWLDGYKLYKGKEKT